MQTIKDNKSLAEAIVNLENVQRSELNLLKQHFDYTIESLNPINIIKDKFSDITSSPTLKSDALKSTLGLASGILANKFILGSAISPVQKILATLVQKGISKVLDSDPEAIKKTGSSFLKNLLSKMKIDTKNS